MIFSALKSFWHKLGSPRWFFEMSQTWVFVLGWMALLLLAAGFVWAIAFAPA
ncbi:MAG TPA: heme ABC transporter permease, partial [Gammaproteobacteria bacterium]|nr:heme ABC transporter permease [Gammaproteobacteria bacterium]